MPDSSPPGHRPEPRRPDHSDSSILAYEMPDIQRAASTGPTEAEIAQETPAVHKLDYSPAPPAHDPYAALKTPGYLFFILGWLICGMGLQVQSASLRWEINERAKTEFGLGSAPLALGFLAGIQVVPLFLLAIPAGHLADTFDRRRLVAISMIGVAACSAALAYLSYVPGSILWMYGVLVVSTTFLVIGQPARSSILPLLVPAEVFPNAVMWNSSIFQASAMIGPAIGGFIVDFSLRHVQSAAIPYSIAAVCCLVFAVLISMLHLRKPIDTGKVDRSVLAGLRFVWRNKPLMGALLLDMFAVLLGGAATLLPIFAADILKVGPRGYGWLYGAEAIGAFCTMMVVAHMPPMKKAGRNMLVAVVGFGAATIVYGLSTNFWLSFVMLMFLGCFDSISVIVRHTLVQMLTPDSMRGRVSAVNNISIGASNQLGGLESGITARYMGTVPAVVFGGIGTIVTVVIIALRFPQIRRIGTLQSIRPEEERELHAAPNRS